MKRVNYLCRSITLLGLVAYQPVVAQTPPPHGLAATYYNGEDFDEPVVERTDAQLNFDWQHHPPATGVLPEHFSARWMGYLEAPATGTYRLHLTADDAARLWLGTTLLWEKPATAPAAAADVRVRLEAGRLYALRIEYVQQTEEARLQFSWDRPDVTMVDFFSGQPTAEPVPARYLWLSRPVPTAPEAEPLPVAPAAVAAAAPGACLQPLRRGATFALPDLYFTQSTADLLPGSLPTLNALARQLREQPGLRLELAGHTDNVGDAARNLHLSEQRARVVRRYLVQQGIDSVRLTARGYGGQRPVADNHDPRQRPRNRRVEVVIR